MDQTAQNLQNKINIFNSNLSTYNSLYSTFSSYVPLSPKTLIHDFDILSNTKFNTVGIPQTAVPYTEGQTGCFNNCLKPNSGCYGADYNSNTNTCSFQVNNDSTLSINTELNINYMIPKQKSILFQLQQQGTILTNQITEINNMYAAINLTTLSPTINSELTTMNSNYTTLQNKRKEIEQKILDIEALSDHSLNLVNKNIQFEIILIYFYAIVFIMFRMMGVSSDISYLIIGGFAIVTGMIIVNKLFF